MTPFMLHLLRHGAPAKPGLLLGHADMAPTPEGLAACTARAQGLDVAAIVASDLRRCAEAAQAIASPRALPVQLDRRWRELDFGAWDGLDPAHVSSAALTAFWVDPDAHAPPGGERWSALHARVGAALAELPGSDVLVVTHGGAMRAALAVLCGFAREQAWAFDLPYAALLSLRVWPGARPTAQVVGLAT
ncbi:histidine phosphatase family protein [Novosphingobium pokkalii]|uniref:Histidine phosphatase family protein n=1 Tax=Novosphingobium pokkalii TaxID=1770194 RepID=A0ABV7V6Z6_9SPHN|nr:histidine phosphatase family protein [Novosphingobium pokkalii]GHC88395.1 hypothetical protein GCM10019060_11130 [Novosphingobium pokkalii]